MDSGSGVFVGSQATLSNTPRGRRQTARNRGPCWPWLTPGNSGGALVDLAGHVVGVPTLAALDPEFGGTPAPGIGFAIPSNTVKGVADRLIASTTP